MPDLEIPVTTLVPAEAALIPQVAAAVDYLRDADPALITTVDEPLRGKTGRKYTVTYPSDGPKSLEEVGPEGAVLRYYSFAVGNGPVSSIFNRLIAEVTGRPTIGKPSPTKGSSWKTQHADRKQMAQGDFAPVHEATLEDLEWFAPNVGKLSLFGWSQAGTILLSGGRRLRAAYDVPIIVSGDFTNAEDRGIGEMLDDFSQAGRDRVHAEANAAKVPALTKAHGANDRPPTKPEELLSNLKYAFHMLTHAPTNLANVRGLGQNKLATNLQELFHDPATAPQVDLIYAENSAIAREAAIMRALRAAFEDQLPEGLGVTKVVGGDHASADNLFVMGALAARL